jgi:hypothetical protein
MNGFLDKKILSLGVVCLLIVIGMVPLVGGYQADECAVSYIGENSFHTQYTVTITRPLENKNYIRDEEQDKIDGVELPVVIGKLTIQADSSPEINRVDFAINDMVAFQDTSSPWEWKWDFKLALGVNKISAIGYIDGIEEARDEISVFSVLVEDTTYADTSVNDDSISAETLG